VTSMRSGKRVVSSVVVNWVTGVGRAERV